MTGKVSLIGARGQRVAPGDVQNTLVYFVPDSGSPSPKSGQYAIYTHHRDFAPAAMAVAAGSTITFTNLDKIRHNVFSVSPNGRFNLGYQATGESANIKFNKPGLVLVNCNVHQGMSAEILVVDTRYVARPDADGNFVLRNVPATPGVLTFWHPRARLSRQSVSAPFSPVSVTLQAIRPHIPMEFHLGAKP